MLQNPIHKNVGYIRCWCKVTVNFSNCNIFCGRQGRRLVLFLSMFLNFKNYPPNY